MQRVKPPATLLKNISEGEILRLILVHLGGGQQKLIIIIHHLVVDGVSWRIIFEDLELAYKQILNKDIVNLGEKTSSFQYWAELIGQSRYIVEKEISYWSRLTDVAIEKIPTKSTKNKIILEDSTEQVLVSLDDKETSHLLNVVPARMNAHINSILLGVLIVSFNKIYGVSNLLIDLQGHGRDDLFNGVDVSRTVGWFTTVYPVLLQKENNVTKTIANTNCYLNDIPYQGTGFGILKYIYRDLFVGNGLDQLAKSQVGFNYLGRFDEVFKKSDYFVIDKLQNDFGRASIGHRPYDMEIDCISIKNEFQILFRFSNLQFDVTAIRKLANVYQEELRNIVTNSRYSDFDYSLSGLEGNELNQFLDQIKNNGGE